MHGELITDLAIVTVVAAVTGMLARRFGQPSILGYLFAGLIVGPYIHIPVFADPQRMAELAEVGVVLVMFAIGLEFRVRRLLEVVPISGITAGVQIGALFWAGYTVGSIAGWSAAGAITLGASLAISSTMVVSAVLRVRPVDPDVRSHVFGVLVVQDLVAIVLIAIVTALASGQTLGIQTLGLIVGQLVGVIAMMLTVGLLLLPRLVRYALRQGDSEGVVVLVCGAAFGLALAADAFGYSVALGAFIAGMAVAESGRGHEIEKTIEPLRALFSGIFFVSIGMTVDPVVAWGSLPFALVLVAVVVGMQFLAVTLATVLTGSSLRRAVFSGFVLGQIGELSFILATIAIAGNLVPPYAMPALVTLATITAFTTPLLLGRAEAVVHALDRIIPDRVHQALTAYSAFLRASRSPGGKQAWRRPALAVLIDWVALVILFVVRGTVLPLIREEFVVFVDIGAALLATPFLVGIVRSGFRLVSTVRVAIRGAAGTTPTARVVESVALLAVVLGVGLPTLAIVRPLIDGPWIETVLSAAILSVLIVLGMRVGRLRDQYTSGVAQLAMEVAERASETDEASAPAPSTHTEGPLAGLDYQTIAIGDESPADRATLAELDLRCRTGATVVAIFRGDATAVLPTGHERLNAGDVLAISGSTEAMERARSVLVGHVDGVEPALSEGADGAAQPEG